VGTLAYLGFFLWLAYGTSDSERAQALLHDLARDSVVTASPPEGAVELRRFVEDGCWDRETGPEEPLVYREYEYTGDLRALRMHYLDLLRQDDWDEVDSSPALLVYERRHGDRYASLRVVLHDDSYEVFAYVQHRFCDEE
jgi:hypothetical protein